MRQVTYNISHALRNGAPLKSGNTRTDGEHVWVHGHMIARAKHDTNELFFTMAGYSTKLTLERLNGLFEILNVPAHLAKEQSRVWLRKDNGMVLPLDANEWYRMPYYPGLVGT